ncbi:MAG: pili assembly chaperone [Proteobacteria bacterium]|nr:pili assembly chaperone [Pseudomonadota bacterium]
MTRINTQFMRTTLLAVSGLLALSLNVDSHAGDGEVQVGRYQSAALDPSDEQIDLLSNIVDIEFPEEINTVGQAIAHLLNGSGYRLLSAKLAESNRSHLFAMPLPTVQRHLGPLRLRQALELLGGPAHHLVVQPTYRLVSFELIKNASSAHDCSDQ